MNLKIGGNSVGKIMYNGQEFGGATKLEPGTILYVDDRGSTSFKNAHLLSTTKNWSNLNGINIKVHRYDLGYILVDLNITSDNFKSLDIKTEHEIKYGGKITVSRSIVDGEYRLNISGYDSISQVMVGAI